MDFLFAATRVALSYESHYIAELSRMNRRLQELQYAALCPPWLEEDGWPALSVHHAMVTPHVATVRQRQTLLISPRAAYLGDVLGVRCAPVIIVRCRRDAGHVAGGILAISINAIISRVASYYHHASA